MVERILEPLNKKEIKEQLEFINRFLETEAQGDWYIYSTLRDELKQLEILLKRYEVI